MKGKTGVVARKVALGKAIGDMDENVVKKAQIRRTIEAHLDKELRYQGRGIKVLSLFFTDKVEKYRHEDGTPGIYAKMFEECYRELIGREEYEPIRERFSADISKIHSFCRRLNPIQLLFCRRLPILNCKGSGHICCQPLYIVFVLKNI